MLMMPLLAFVFGSALVAAAAYALMPSRAAAIDRRLEELTLGRERDDKPKYQSVVGVLKRLGEKAPKSPKEMGSLRLRLVQAGFRRDEALTLFFGVRVLFALALFLLFATPLIFRPNLTVALGGLGLGYILPGMVLARLAKRRAHRIRLSLADMLDLLARHSRLDIELRASGDLGTGAHHTTEDVGIVLGKALDEALGDRAGIARYGDASVPMDESLAICAISALTNAFSVAA